MRLSTEYGESEKEAKQMNETTAAPEAETKKKKSKKKRLLIVLAAIICWAAFGILM